MCFCEKFELRSHFKSRLSLIIWVNVVLNMTVVADSDWRFDGLFSSQRQSQSELYWLVNYVAMLLVVCQFSGDVIDYGDS